MDYAIETLQERLSLINDVYESYVLKGLVSSSSPKVIEIMKCAEQLQGAIILLSGIDWDNEEKQIDTEDVERNEFGDEFVCSCVCCGNDVNIAKLNDKGICNDCYTHNNN